MRVSPIEDLDLMDRLGQSSGPRTRGVVHLSDIIKIIMRRLQPLRFDASKPMDLKRVEIGLLFENMLERALAEKFATIRPGELVSTEGIYMNPDGVNPDLIAGEEYKATFMSSSKGLTESVWSGGIEYQTPLAKFLHWFIQMMGYAKWLEVNDFILRVLWINGDYKWHKDPISGRSAPTGPQFKSYRIHFTDQEIDENWAAITYVGREEGLIS